VNSTCTDGISYGCLETEAVGSAVVQYV